MHSLASVSTRASTAAAVAALDNLARRQVSLRNLRVMCWSSDNSADTRRSLNVLSILSARNAAQFLAALLLPHGDQVLVSDLPFYAKVVHVL